MGQNNLAVLETYLKDILFSEEEIQKKVELRDHIFEIKDKENSLGFISLYDLKAYVFEHEDEARNYFVRNIDSKEWKNIFEHAYFQRRKPQLISSENLADDDDNEFYILIKGQKHGPYEKYELTEMLNSKEILLTDMVSSNAGHTWTKLYQVDGFDRRTLKGNEELPGLPASEILSRPNNYANPISEATEAISSLAYLGNVKRGKSIERERQTHFQDEMAKKGQGGSFYKWMLFLSVCGIVYFMWNIKGQLSSPFKSEPAAVGEQAEMLTPVDTTSPSYANPSRGMQQNNGINDQRRAGKFQTRQLNPVRAYTNTGTGKAVYDTNTNGLGSRSRKSFMESGAMIDSSNPNEDTSYYYDNVQPMELDPVRSQISKENYDNGGAEAAPAPGPDNDPLFNQEVQN